MAPEVGLGFETIDLLGILRALSQAIQHFSGTILAPFLLHTLLHTSI